MNIIGIALLAVGGIGSLVCGIMVLIKMFQNDKPLIGVLGILCSLWAFIWGWMKSRGLGLKKIMMIWSACIALTIVGNILFGLGMASQMQNQMQNGGFEGAGSEFEGAGSEMPEAQPEPEP